MSDIEGWRNTVIRTIETSGAQSNLRVRMVVFTTRRACRAV
jgi:hypothetical protein